MASDNDIVKEKPNFLYIATIAMGIVAVGAAIWPLIDQMNPSKDVAAITHLDIDLREIPEGESRTVLREEQPIIIRHRTADEIARARADDNASMPYPEKDEDRVVKPEWLVIHGVCDAFGNIVTDKMGDGWFCIGPSNHYDTSGRIRRGASTVNLYPIDHIFLDDNTMRIEAFKSSWSYDGSASMKYNP